jgi:hypothetical protein
MAEAGKSTEKRRHRAKSELGATRVAVGARLKKAAARELRKNGEKLAKALMDKALEGNVASAKMVVELAEEKKDEETPKKRRPRGLTLAQRLALEPSWDSLTPEQQKQSLIQSGLWDFEHDCRKGEWVPSFEERMAGWEPG